MKRIAKLALATLALASVTLLASCGSKGSSVPSYAPNNASGGYIMPSK